MVGAIQARPAMEPSGGGRWMAEPWTRPLPASTSRQRKMHYCKLILLKQIRHQARTELPQMEAIARRPKSRTFRAVPAILDTF